MWRVAPLAILLCWPAMQILGQSARATPNFEDLAQRAAAAVDSQPSEAVKLYREALRLRPSWAEGWFYLGASEYELKEYAGSEAAFLRTTSLAPENGVAWAFLGLCEYSLGDRQKALEHINKGEALGIGDNKPFISVVRQRAALMAIRTGAFEAGLEQLNPVAKFGDDSQPVLEAYGLGTLGISSDPQQLSASKQELVNLAGKAAWAYAAQRPDEAKANFDALVEKYPSEPGVHYAYGIFLAPRNPEAALAEFQKELKSNPTHVYARLQTAFLELKAGNADSAVADAREAVKLDGANYLAHTALGRALSSTGQTDAAIQELQTAARLAPGEPQIHFYLEQAYKGAGKLPEAAKQRAEFTRLKRQRDPLSLPETAKR